MRLSPATRNLLRGGVAITLAFIYIPLIVIAIYAFNGGNPGVPPPTDDQVVREAIGNQGARRALDVDRGRGRHRDRTPPPQSRLVRGALRFFGRETISFLVVLPIALPEW
jgi:putative spermidine/putrescine transport system permease protein